MLHCYVQCWRLSFSSMALLLKYHPASTDSTRFWGLEVELDDDWHNMTPRDAFKMESYELMIEEKTSWSTSSLSIFILSHAHLHPHLYPHTHHPKHIGALRLARLANPRHQPPTLGPLEINSWKSAWAWLGTFFGICPSLNLPLFRVLWGCLGQVELQSVISSNII